MRDILNKLNALEAGDTPFVLSQADESAVIDQIEMLAEDTTEDMSIEDFLAELAQKGNNGGRQG